MYFALTASNANATITTTQTILNTSDQIQLLGIIISSLMSFIAIVISVITLRQNNKMLEESSRPNIQIYPVFMDSILYIIVKNFGSSEAIIDEVQCSHEFTDAESFGKSGKDIFHDLSGAIFSPGYSIRCPLVGHAVSNETFEFHIKYHSATKKYSATYAFNPYKNVPFADTYPTGKSAEDHLHNIEKDLHGLLKLKL